MSTSNRQRRAAEHRQRQQERRRQRARWGSGPRPDGSSGARASGPGAARPDAQQAVRGLVEQVRMGSLPARSAPVAVQAADSAACAAEGSRLVGTLLTALARDVVGRGWLPSDLGEIVGQRLGARAVAVVVDLLHAERARHRPESVAEVWSEELASLDPPRPLHLQLVGDLEVGIGLAALLASLPPIAVLVPPPGQGARSPAPAPGAQEKVLTRVRALLAKAEATPYAEEAETLSAKAQELISRYALDRLTTRLDAPPSAAGPGAPDVAARRLWLHPPYVLPKGLLADAVAAANRCTTVLSEQLGFVTVIGEPPDLDAVELLTTSLLVQADAAMLAWGSQSDGYGTSRTRSFRRAFLLAYAGRIGERLRAITVLATESSGRAGELVPLLRDQSERVDALRDSLFSGLVSRSASVSNGSGWAAGRAAADRARIDLREELGERAG